MLSKVLFIVSALALAAGTFLGFKNRQAFIDTRKEKISINIQHIKPTLEKIDEEIANLSAEHDRWRDAVASRKDKEAALANAQSLLRSKTADLAKVENDIKEKEQDLTSLETQLAILLENETIDTINSKIEMLNQEIATLETDRDKASGEMEMARGVVTAQEGTVASLQRSASERNQGISQNALEGMVIATNQDYGFAVVNLGERNGVTGGSKFIVKRGNQRIGTLNISSISNNRTIADIESDSVPPGTAISPGDRVIFEKVQR